MTKDKLFNQDLLDEFKLHGDDKAFENKVARIYFKALRAGKINLCDRIQEKYAQYFKESDLAMALYFASMVKFSKKDK